MLLVVPSDHKTPRYGAHSPRTHQVAARKGEWSLGDDAALSEQYDRLEFAGSMVSAEVLRLEHTVAYASASMRVDIGLDGNTVVAVYEREDAAAATGEIQRLLGTPAERENVPRWEQADLARRDSGGPTQTSTIR